MFLPYNDVWQDCIPILDLTKLQNILNSLSWGGGSPFPSNFSILLGFLEFVLKKRVLP